MVRQPTVALVVHPSLTHYFVSDQTCIKPVISHSVVLRLLRHSNTFQNDPTPYAHRYLFGFDGYKGILCDYIDHGCQVNVVCEDHFRSAFGRLMHNYEWFDFQLSGNIDATYPAALFRYNKGAIGWAPPVLGSKKFQTFVLANSPLTSCAVPRQIHLSTLGHVGLLANQSIEKYFPSDYVIAKPFYSSRSRMLDDSDYRVLHTSCWGNFVRELTANPDWFCGTNGIIISEFIQTADPFSDHQNAVVHKINLPSGLNDSDLGEWPFACDKFVGAVKLDRARHAVQPFGYVLEEQGWVDGSLDQFRTILRDILNALLPVPCLVSIDLIIRPSGKVAFLEINKLAGTFENASGTERCSLERYMAFAIPFLLNKQSWSEKLDTYSTRLLEVIPRLANLQVLPKTETPKN